MQKCDFIKDNMLRIFRKLFLRTPLERCFCIILGVLTSHTLKPKTAREDQFNLNPHPTLLRGFSKMYLLKRW